MFPVSAEEKKIIKKTIRFSPFPEKNALFTVCLLLLFREYGILYVENYPEGGNFYEMSERIPRAAWGGAGAEPGASGRCGRK